MLLIIKKWRKNGITSPSQVKAEQEAYAKSKGEKNDDRLQSKPTYDLDEYAKYLKDACNLYRSVPTVTLEFEYHLAEICYSKI